ncbi:hypothetical protein AV656_08235 [Bhargavaea cecembensis]|uniref:Uncharacterized protein n=1 Tax=Bhargavaea cecembensis TaxID=394098 RepID=A0A165H5Z4_9BACL|nr:hypothetical protein [Bhargavaea cecembensis]KZE38878.1 hypothetical protein AV656_08235 [Bhargavaea cecembensis]
MTNLIHVEDDDVKPVGQYEIIDTGWRTDGLFVVILGAEGRALLESSDAHNYARMVAGRRRHGIPVTAEQVESGNGKFPYQRMFCFSRAEQKAGRA